MGVTGNGNGKVAVVVPGRAPGNGEVERGVDELPNMIGVGGVTTPLPRRPGMTTAGMGGITTTGAGVGAATTGGATAIGNTATGVLCSCPTGASYPPRGASYAGGKSIISHSLSLCECSNPPRNCGDAGTLPLPLLLPLPLDDRAGTTGTGNVFVLDGVDDGMAMACANDGGGGNGVPDIELDGDRVPNVIGGNNVARCVVAVVANADAKVVGII